ncbi:MAG: mechanosensitive ion channel [Magnetococcales bacterium]|nr:mechanosensitive ion channel [Magnetococcales bacterium]
MLTGNLAKTHWLLMVCLLLVADLLFNLQGHWIDGLPEWVHAGQLVDFLTILWWYGGAWAVVRGVDLFVWQRLYGVDTPGVPRPRRELTDIFDLLVYLAVTAVILVEVFHQPVSGIFATSGVVAVIVGLALQNTLSDLFAGLALNIERPFKAGDWITLDGVQGLVLFTNWRATHLRTRTMDDMILPNSVVSKARLHNHSRPTRINMLQIDVPLRPASDPQEVARLLQTATTNAKGVLSDPAPFALLVEMRPGHVIWRVHAPFDDFAQASRVRSAVNLSILESIHAAGRSDLLPDQHLWLHSANGSDCAAL